MQGALQLFNLADNPVFHRYRRSQLRLKRSVFWYLATLILTTFVISLSYIIQTNIGFSEQYAARNQWTALLVIQGLILLIKGTGRTSAGLIQDKIDQTLDYQRLTPVSPLRNVVGYLFGLPILEYVMFALTLPHLAFVVVKGNIPLSAVLAVYGALFTCTIFYHTTAIAIGMVMKRWLWGYLLSIFSVAFLNLILVPLGAVFGLKFLQYLSVFPVIGQKVQPLMVPQNPDDVPDFRQPPFGPPGEGQPDFGPPGPAGAGPGPQFQSGPVNADGEAAFTFADPVPFFEWTLSPLVFTLLLQAGLIFTFATMAVRRWQKEDKHSLSKPFALGFLAVFLVLLIGNVWPVITRDYLPFAILGNTDLDSLADSIAVALPLLYAMIIWILSIFLYANVVPTHNQYVRGVRRAKKLGREKALPWDDDSANMPFMSLFVVLGLAGFWVLYSQMSGAGYMEFLEGTRFQAWRLPLALGLVLVYSLLLLQVLEQRGTTLTILLLWLLPILVSIVSAASMQNLTSTHTIVASLSPLALILMTGVLPLESVVPISPDDDVSALFTGSTTGMIFVSIQIVLLALRWRQLSRRLH